MTFCSASGQHYTATSVNFFNGDFVISAGKDHDPSLSTATRRNWNRLATIDLWMGLQELHNESKIKGRSNELSTHQAVRDSAADRVSAVLGSCAIRRCSAMALAGVRRALPHNNRLC